MYQIFKKYYYAKHCIGNNYKSQIAYVENNLYKEYDNRTFNNTNNISKNVHQYTNHAVNNFKFNKVSNLKNT